MKTPLYKIEMYIAELGDHYGIEDIKTQIDQELDDYLVEFGKIETVDIGEFSDEHPLNTGEKKASEYFKEAK